MDDLAEHGPDCETLQFAEDFPELEIAIYPEGDEATFHTFNDPEDPEQRPIIAQRSGRVDIRCEHKDIVHGYLSEDVDDLYSLIIVKLRFDPNGIAARIKEARVTFKFATSLVGKPDPEVVDMFPNGSFFVEPTQQHEQTVHSTGLNIGGGAAGLQAAVDLKREKTVDRDAVSFTRVIGAIELLRDYGKDNAVSWKMFENPTDKTGIVSTLQCAILLKRVTMDPFKATVTIEVTADTITRIEAVFRKDQKDDDVLYNPNRAPTNRLRQYDVNNLGAVDLKSVSDVTFRTLLKNAVKNE